MTQFQQHYELIVFIVIGMLAGLFAQMIVPGKGFGMVGSVIVGLVGCLIGGYYIQKFITFTDNDLIKRVISATAGAVLLTIPANIIAGNSHKDKTKYRNNA